MEIAQARADLKKRQEAVVAELNQIAATKQQLLTREQGLIIQAHKLNGENDMLNRLSNDGKKQKPK